MGSPAEMMASLYQGLKDAITCGISVFIQQLVSEDMGVFILSTLDATIHVLFLLNTELSRFSQCTT